MPDPVTGGIIGTSIIGGGISAYYGNKAAEAQADAAAKGVGEQRRQFNVMQELLSPYVTAGNRGLGGYEALLGLRGTNQQQGAIRGIEQSPEFAALTAQGENAILQNASATGGLRGGNVQGALGQFRPALLSQLINQRYAQLGNLTSLGQASAAGVGAGAMQTGANIANLYGQQGSATAGGYLATANAIGQPLNAIQSLGGAYLGSQWAKPSGNLSYATGNTYGYGSPSQATILSQGQGF